MAPSPRPSRSRSRYPVPAPRPRLEEVLRRSVLGGDDFLNEVASHLIEAGGKWLRPALTIASALLGDSPITHGGIDTTSVASPVEASSTSPPSTHDDVMDEATMRRRGRRDSVNSRWGNIVAIVAGDFLLARSAEIAASLGPEIAGLLASTLARLCQGQVAETRTAFQPGPGRRRPISPRYRRQDGRADVDRLPDRRGSHRRGSTGERSRTLTRSSGSVLGSRCSRSQDEHPRHRRHRGRAGQEAGAGPRRGHLHVAGAARLALADPGAGPELVQAARGGPSTRTRSPAPRKARTRGRRDRGGVRRRSPSYCGQGGRGGCGSSGTA